MLTLVCLAVLSVVGAGDVDVYGHLLPYPQQVEARDGAFAPGDLDFVLKTPDKASADRLQARLKESRERLGIGRGSDISEYPVPDTFALLIFSGETAVEAPAASLPAAGVEEGYVLEVTPGGIGISARTEQGLFYGMMTAEQLLAAARQFKQGAIPCARIVDWPALKMRGYHEDYGRDQLPTIEDHKRTIRTLAQFKMNTHLWFIESDHFVYKFDPTLGEEYDRFTMEELRDLAKYAQDYYIEVIPVVESLAHMENTLKNPKYAHLAEVEGAGTICPTCEESIKFVQTIINEIAPQFPGKYFHCALDESQVVGQGKSAEAVKEKGIERVYADYYTRLNDTVKANGKQMMMYADIVLNHPAVIDMLPRDIVMMYWDYMDKEHDPGIELLAKAGFPTVTLSGMWDWVNLYPLYVYGFKNIEQLAARSTGHGVLGTFVSNWGDWNLGAAGANLSELTTFGAVYCGVQGWRPQAIPLDAFSGSFAVQYFGARPDEMGEALALLARSQGETLYGNQKARRMSVSNPYEYMPGFASATEEDMAYWRNMKTCAERAHVLIKKSTPRLNADYARSHDLAARMLAFSADLAIQYQDTAVGLAQPQPDLRSHADKYRALIKRQKALWEEYREVYAATNRPINLRYLVLAWDDSQATLTQLVEDLDAADYEAIREKHKAFVK